MAKRPKRRGMSGMRDRMNSATSGAPKFDNQAVGSVFDTVSKREHKSPTTVRGPGGNTISLKPRSPKEVARDSAARANKRGRRGSG